MENLLTSAAQQAPALTLMVVTVLAFLRHLSARDRALKDISKECHRVHVSLTEQVIASNTRTNGALDANSGMLGEVRSELRAVHHVLVRLNGGPST